MPFAEENSLNVPGRADAFMNGTKFFETTGLSTLKHESFNA